MNWQALLLSLAWVLFMVFFTYTALVVELLEKNGDFYKLFYLEQSQYISLFVNVGIVIMLLFDNHLTGNRYSGPAYYLPLFAILLCLTIKAHCDLNVQDGIKDYIYPICEKRLSVFAYCIFLFMVYILKARSLWKFCVIKKEL